MKQIQNIIIVTSLLFISVFVNGQSKIDSTYNLEIECCRFENKVIDTIYIEGEIIRYKIISKEKLYTKGTIDFIEGYIILPDFDSNSDSSLLKKIFNKIGKNNNINEFNAFKDCEALNIYYQGMKPLKEQEEHLENSFIGIFKIIK